MSAARATGCVHGAVSTQDITKNKEIFEIMISLNLTATTAEQIIIKDYLKSNASETLAEKINNGVRIEKDGKTLINKKDLTTFMNYACEEAKKQADKGARFACIDQATVFGWAIHYFEESDIEGVLHNEDGTEYKPLKPVTKSVKPSITTPAVPPAPKEMTLFDLMDGGEPPQASEIECTESDIITSTDGTADNKPDISQELHRISDTQMVDNDGVIHEIKPASDKSIPSVLTKILGDTPLRGEV